MALKHGNCFCLFANFSCLKQSVCRPSVESLCWASSATAFWANLTRFVLFATTFKRTMKMRWQQGPYLNLFIFQLLTCNQPRYARPSHGSIEIEDCRSWGRCKLSSKIWSPWSSTSTDVPNFLRRVRRPTSTVRDMTQLRFVSTKKKQIIEDPRWFNLDKTCFRFKLTLVLWESMSPISETWDLRWPIGKVGYKIWEANERNDGGVPLIAICYLPKLQATCFQKGR